MSEVQVSKEHYNFSRYGFEGRFVSYHHQLSEVLKLEPLSVLEVGVGDKVFGNFLKENTKVSYTSLDVDQELKPDVVGSILKLPFKDDEFDVACAFEVLEHLPFSDVDQALGELARVAKRYVVVSVPHFGPMFSFSLKVPFIPHIQMALKVPFPKPHFFNGQHYWELGKKGYPARVLREKLVPYGKIIRDFVPFNSAYHHFFVLELK